MSTALNLSRQRSIGSVVTTDSRARQSSLDIEVSADGCVGVVVDEGLSAPPSGFYMNLDEARRLRELLDEAIAHSEATSAARAASADA